MSTGCVLNSLVGTRGSFLFSTRFDDVGNNSIHLIQFDTLEDHCSGVLLFNKHLGISEDDPRYNADVRDRILKVCAGLPLALATAASLVRQLDYIWELVSDGLKEELITKDSIKARHDCDPGGHPGLKSTIELILEKIDSKELGDRLLRLTNRFRIRQNFVVREILLIRSHAKIIDFDACTYFGSFMGPEGDGAWICDPFA